MIDNIVKKMSIQLETITRDDISVERALDLLEASTDILEEILAINIMRESMRELEIFKMEHQESIPGKVVDVFPEVSHHVA